MYFYNKYKRGDHCRIHEPLKEFIESEAAQAAGNGYIRQLTAAQGANEDVERAITNLQQFHLVGVLEELNTLVQDCNRILGINLDIGHRNFNPRTAKEQSDEITPEIDKRVRKICEPNLRVYESVRQRIAMHGSWLVE